MQTKVCSKCGEEKPVDSYHKEKGGKYCVTSVCKSCKKQYYQRYYQKTRKYKNTSTGFRRSLDLELEDYL